MENSVEKNTEAFQPDSRSIALHLRTIHFILAVVCIVLFLATFFIKTKPFVKAWDNALVVQKIAKSWDIYVGQKACKQRIKTLGLSKVNDPFTMRYSSSDKKLYVSASISNKRYVWNIRNRHFNTNHFSCQHNEMPVINGKLHKRNRIDNQVATRLRIVNKPYTVDQFRQQWNSIDKKSTIYNFEKLEFEHALVITKKYNGENLVPTIISSGKVILRPKLNEGDMPRVANLEYFRIANVKTREIFGFKKNDTGITHYILTDSNYSRNSDVPKYELLIPIRTSRHSIDVQQLVFTIWRLNNKKLKIRKGSFDKAFPALAEVTRKNPNIKLASLMKYLEQEKSKSSNSVNLFNITVSIPVLRKVGAFIIVLILLYYMLNLRVLAYKLGPNDKSLSVAWIGVYPYRISFFSTLLTSILLPLVVTLLQFLELFSTASFYDFLVSAISLGVLGFLSIILFIINIKLYRKLRIFAKPVKEDLKLLAETYSRKV